MYSAGVGSLNPVHYTVPASISSAPPLPSVTLKILNPELSSRLKTLTPTELLKTFKEQGCKGAIAAKSLRSGDLKTALSKLEDKKRLEDTKEWDNKFQGQAKTVTPTYAVEIVSVRINQGG
jgi:hypothetical protein